MKIETIKQWALLSRMVASNALEHGEKKDFWQGYLEALNGLEQLFIEETKEQAE